MNEQKKPADYKTGTELPGTHYGPGSGEELYFDEREEQPQRPPVENKSIELKVIFITGKDYSEKQIARKIIDCLSDGEGNTLIVPYKQSADQDKRKEAIGFSEFIKIGKYSWDEGQDAWVGEVENEDNLILTAAELYDRYLTDLQTIKV